MYIRTAKPQKGTRIAGMAVAVAAIAGLGYVVATSVNKFIAAEETRTELALITPPPPPPVEIPEPPKVEVVKEVEAPPAPPEIVVADIEVFPEELPAIVAPVSDPIPQPDPAPVMAPPAPQTRSAPKLLASQKPDYPSAAIRAGEQGTTQLEVCVNAGGRVTSVAVARSSGSKRLDDAAAKWIRGERFQPARINGSAQDVCGHSVYYEWSLRDV